MADEGLFGGGAAFGVFPQMGGRRRLQDPQASADVPFQGFRGSVAGLLGLLPDVANFMGRSPMPTETFGEFDYGPRQQLPYGSEFYLKELPLAPTSPVGQLAGQVGSFVPLSPMPAVRGAQTVGRMVGQRMAENVAMGRPSLPSMLAEPRASLFAVEPSAMMPKPQAQVSELGFYSAAEQAAMNLARNKGTGQSFLNDLMKAPDVKKDELVWTGLDDFLANKPNVTKQEVQDYLSGNRVDVQERQLSGRGDKSGVFSEFNPDKNQFMVYGEDLSHTHAFNTAEEADNFVKQFNSQIPYGPSKYDKYQLPGGDNYREILLTLPKQSPTTGDIANKLFGKEMRFLSEAEKDAVVAEARRIEDTTPKDYVSSHFNEPNILAHIRVNDRVDADGKKMLLIEEIQSDWHQAGREKGYETPELKSALKEYEQLVIKNANGQKLSADEMARVQELRPMVSGKSGGVPDAPFKDTWYQLALKRVLKHAADNGYERVGLTTGKQQAQRFDLSKQVDEITVPMVNEDGTRSVRIDPTEGTSIKLMVDAKGVVTGYGGGSTQFSGKKLSEVIGKDIADKVMQANANAKFTGLDLSVGGEGMKKYYDEIYPKFLDKYGKKWNAKVGETQITTDYARDANGIPAQRPSKEPVRYIDITPEMKGAVSKGQPLFAAAPVGSIGLGYQKDKADNLEETSPTYTDPFGNTIGSSIR
jgi:hypothetical protein